LDRVEQAASWIRSDISRPGDVAIAEYQHWGSVELSTKISHEVFTRRDIEDLARLILVAGAIHTVNVGVLRARFVKSAVVGDEADILRSIVLAEEGYGIGLYVAYPRHKGEEPNLGFARSRL
jgi:hypothetical protein